MKIINPRGAGGIFDVELALVREAVSDIDGPDARWVRNEIGELPRSLPDRWIAGYHLRGTMTTHLGAPDTPAPGALIQGSLTASRFGVQLSADDDFIVDEFWSSVGGARTPGLTAFDYGYSLLRIDSVVRDAAGELDIVRGTSHLTTPRPPQLPFGLARIANVLVPYDSDGHQTRTLLTIGETGAVRPNPVHLPRFSSALSDGNARVAFWGDSVTAGGNSGSVAASFPSLVAQRLAERYRHACIGAQTIAHPGSTSRDWLVGANEKCDFGRLVDSNPDLVVVEFVNDADLPPGEWEGWYDEIVERVSALGADLMLTTPHWTLQEWMPGLEHENEDRRPYSFFLRGYAAQRNIALADVSEGWHALRSQGIPYRTLLSNGINHPDERGHMLAATVIFDQIIAGVEGQK